MDAFAVAASFAVRNPAHELLAREIITGKTGKPVTISSELSSALDAPRRALTAALNARLISRISRLIEAVGRAMRQLGIACPLMIVKGDGTLALAETVALRPIETVMSGPAASLVGARWLSGLDSFIMSDMGGTTTDLGIVVDGRLQIADEGAEIGGWRTMVKAADVRTVGLGGDSEVHIGMNGSMTVGPGRIVPLSLIGSRFPETLDLLGADLADNEGGSLHGKFVLRPFGSGQYQDSVELSPREREIMALVGDRPIAIRKVAMSSGAQRSLAGLRRQGPRAALRLHAVRRGACARPPKQLVGRGSPDRCAALRAVSRHEGADCRAGPRFCPGRVERNGAPFRTGRARQRVGARTARRRSDRCRLQR